MVSLPDLKASLKQQDRDKLRRQPPQDAGKSGDGFNGHLIINNSMTDS